MNPETKTLLEIKAGRPHRLLVKFFQQAIADYEADCRKRSSSGELSPLNRRDVASLILAHGFYKRGDMRQARNKIARLDTIVRDAVPCVCYAQIFGDDVLLPNGLRRRQKELAKLRESMN